MKYRVLVSVVVTMSMLVSMAFANDIVNSNSSTMYVMDSVESSNLGQEPNNDLQVQHSEESISYWNNNPNYPEVENSANGQYTYYFDKSSVFRFTDGSRNLIFGVNMVTMINNQYGPIGLFKYKVIPGMNQVYRYDAADNLFKLAPGTSEWAMFQQVWKLTYGTDFH